MKKVAIFLVRIYQHLKPSLDGLVLSVFGVKSECKMSPTCSQYMIESIEKYGTMRGILRGVRRILACH